jgi:dienelactone hydrolase
LIYPLSVSKNQPLPNPPPSRRDFLLAAASMAAPCDVHSTDKKRILADFELLPTFTYQGKTKPIYKHKQGRGPGVLLIHELPGLTLDCLTLANRLVERGGFSVYVPLLFGAAGEAANTMNTVRVLFDGDWSVTGKNKSSRITNFLRGLANKIAAETPGRGIGVVGNCLTGGLPIALLTEKCVVAPVCCQPSIPMFGNDSDLGISKSELDAALRRTDVPIYVYRFKNDTLCKHARWQAIKDAFGETRFHGLELDSEHPAGRHKDHAVLTAGYNDCPGTQTRAAFDAVLAFLKSATSLPAPSPSQG